MRLFSIKPLIILSAIIKLIIIHIGSIDLRGYAYSFIRLIHLTLQLFSVVMEIKAIHHRLYYMVLEVWCFVIFQKHLFHQPYKNEHVL